jgi:tricorn protease
MRRLSAAVVTGSLAIIAFLFMPIALAGSGDGYLRYPDIHGDLVVFGAESDLWLAPVDGSSPGRRLTTHPGTEYFPQFSPDGGTIAFTGEYDGNRDIFVVPTAGGEPLRLTWHPGADEVIGWTPDGGEVLFRSRRADPHGSQELFRIPAAGGDPQKLPLGWAARLAIDPDSGLWAFNRKQRETRTWKRYRGGTAPDIWVGDPGAGDFRPVVDSDANDTFPMWHDGRLFFMSDRGGTVNIWSATAEGDDVQQHTRFATWDARWPSMGPDGSIVFTLAADIHVFDPATGKERIVPVELPSDRTLTRVRYPDAQRNVTRFDLSPEGDRLAVVARGEIFSVPTEEGVTLPVTLGSGARERAASFTADGKQLIYISDSSGEEAIHRKDAWGRGDEEVVLPAEESGWHFAPRSSPGGKWVAFGDSSQTLFVISQDGGKPQRVDQGLQGAITSYRWSPDGRWLAYAKADTVTDYSSIFIYDTQEKESFPVTGPTTDDGSPAWDPEGRYLYFASSRAINPILGTQDWDNVEARNNKLYMVVLTADGKNPLVGTAGLPPEEEDDKEGDEEDSAGDKDDEKDKDSGEDDDKKADGDDKKKEGDDDLKPVKIDLAGLADRVLELPVGHGTYFGLEATGTHLFFLSAPLQGFAEMPGLFQPGGPNLTLMSFDLKEKKVAPFAEGISAYDLSGKGGKVAIMKQPGDFYVVATAAPPGPALAEGQVSLAGMIVELNPLDEWRQIYYEGWRHMRDYYWDENMGGVDWQQERDRYATLLPRVSSRSDLNDLMGELIGEMSTSHTYIFGGDPGVQVARVPTGMLGAQVERVEDAYRVTRIYRADAADNVRSPLSAPGVNIKEGDFILEVNHRGFPADRPLLAGFAQQAGKEVILTVNDSASREGSRQVVIQPMASEADLIYADWVRQNREYVAEKTGGRMGYIHVPDMWQSGLIEFNTWFYPQLDKEGMVVDTRWNGGGAVSQMLVERLRRSVDSFDRGRGGSTSTYPARTLNGPFVVLTNEFAGSDGDIFPYVIQLEGLAPVIGTRSWGGVVGISSMRPMVDGGLMTQPESAWWDTQDGWDLENKGVIPDIQVQNLPQEVARGIDAQLNRGIEELVDLHRQDPPVRPDFGPVRDRSRKAYRDEVSRP